MNKVFMTKRRNDGKIVVCSELTRARGKMKSVVTAVAAALSVGVAGEAMADLNVYPDIIHDQEPSGADLIKISPDAPEEIGYLYGNKMSALDENASNTLRLFTNCKEGGAPDDPTSCGDMSYLVFQDTDNTTTVSTNASKSFLSVTKGAVTKNTAQGIGSNTDYQLDFNYDDSIFNVTNDGKFSLKYNTSSPLTIGANGLDLNYNTTTLGLDNDGKLTALPSTVTLPKVYFHANNGTATGGDANTNLGELTEAAGATGKFSVTAGVNATATNTSSVAIGHSVTSKGYGSITIGDSSTSSSTKVEWVASKGTTAKTFEPNGVYYTKITTTKKGNQVEIKREVFLDADGKTATVIKDASGKITDVTGVTEVDASTVKPNSTTFTGATGAGSIAMGADTINTTSAISKLALVNRAPITNVSGKLTSNSNYGEIVTLPKDAAPSVQAPTASGDAAIAIGAKTTAQGDGSIALGALATALPEYSIAIGTGAITRSFLDPYSKRLQATQSIAIGYLATSENQGSVSLGTTAQALHDQALALGAATYASGFNSAAIGNNNKATGYGAFVIGGDDAGKKDVASNKIEGANTEYASLFYNPVLGEVVANAYASVNSTGQTITGITGRPNVYTVRAVDITEASTNPVETKYVINGSFNSTETAEFRKITGKGLSARALTDAEVATLTAQGYKVLNKADFTVEKLALEIYDPLGYVSGMVAQYKAQGKTDAEIETLKPELYKHLLSYSGNSGTAYSPYQEATSSGVGSIAFGLKTQATQDGAIAMGVASNAHAKESIAVGVGTVTTGERAVSVGSRSIASGERSIAIGTYSEAPDAAHGETRYDSPRALADDAVAIGTGAYVGLDVQGTKSVALGSGSIVTTGHGDIKENLLTGAWEGILRNYKHYDPNKEPGVNADGETDKQFTLGNTTTGGTTGTINKAYVGKLIYKDFAGQTAVGAVSVGYGDNEKRIQNVAAGEISPTSTDAINGSQLYMVAYELGKEVESSYFHVNRADSTQQVGDTNTNKGKLDDYAGARSNYAVTAGVNTRAVGIGSISMGHEALSGMTTAQYTEMAAIDSVLQSNITKRETAANQIIAADKTLKYVAEQRTKLNDAIAQYNTDIDAIKVTISNTTNTDELARLNAQLNKMIASRDLLEGQKPELNAMETAANDTKTKAVTDRDTAAGVIATKQAELTAYLTTNKKDYALAIGSQAIASGTKSIAIGKDNNASGNQSIAIGTGNIVSGDRSGAFGDPSIVAGAGSYTYGNDNAVGAQANNVTALGNNNQIGAKATYGTDGKLDSAQDLTAESAVENSKVLGNNNYINSSNTYVLGSGVGVKDDGSLLSTVANSVYLGNDSTIKDSNVEITQTNAGTVKNFTKDGADGTTSTAGANGNVTTSNVANIVYGAFAGAVANGAVTVGSAGAERRIMNVAAGEISASSTDAINGSQLYFVAKQAATPFTVKANTLNDTDALMLDKQYAEKDGKQVQLGQEFSILGAKDSKSLTRNQDAATDGTYSAKNIQTIVDDAGVQIQFAEKPEFKEVTAKDGDKVSKLSPTNITTTDGTSTTTIAPNSITVGDKVGTDDKPVTITSGQNGGTISNLDGNLDGAKSGTTAPTTSATKPTLTESNAATVGDVLNAGWNLKENNTAKDFVTAYDTVDFVNGNGTTVNITSTNGVSKVKVDVNTTALSNTSTVGGTADGKIYAPAGDEGKLVNATTVANAINQAAWNTLAKASGTGKVDGTATSAAINAGDKVNFVAGNNLVIKQENNQAGTETDFTYSLASDLKGINSISNNAANGDNVTTITLSNDPADKKVTLNDAKLTGVKDGEIADNSSDAINGSQLKDLADKTGLTVNNAKDGFDTPTFTNLKNVDGTNITTAPTTIKGAIDNTIEVVNKGLKFGADNNKANPTTQQLGSALTVESGDVNDTTNNVAYKGDNLATFYENTNGNGKIVIGLSEKPVFKEVTAKDGDKVSKLSPTNITTTDGTSTTTIAPDSITVGNKAGDTDKPVTITSGQNGGTISNLDGNLDGAKSGTTAPTTEASKPNNLANNNAATVGDVLNAGWNLQGNGVAKDFVKPYDTVNFADGTGTTVDVSTDADGKVSTVKVNTVMQYTDASGNPVKKVGNSYYPADSVVDAAGNVYPAGTQLDQDGNVVGDATEVEPVENVQVNVVNPTDNTSTTATKLGNVDAGAGTLDGSNRGDKPTADTPTVIDDSTPLGTEIKNAYNGLADLANAVATNVMTVADAKNLGWVVSASGDNYADDVRNANQVDFVGTGLATVTGKTDDKGVRTITVNVDAQRTVEAADTPVIYTDKDGNKLTKVDGTFYNAEKYEDLPEKPTDTNAPDYQTKLDEYNAALEDAKVDAGDVIASMNDGDNKADNPKQLANVGGNLTPTYNTGDAKETDGKLGDTTADAPTKSQTAPTAADVKKMYNNAATVGDVLNAGWNLQGNGVAKDFVKPYDTVNFADGTGTKVDVSTDADGKVSTVKVNVDTVGLTNNPNGKVVTPAESLQKALDAANQELRDLQATGTATPEALKAAQDKVTDAQKAFDNAGNKIATAADVANAINKSGWNVTSAVATGSTGSVTGTTDELINPGEQVTFKAGNNMVLKQEGNNFTYSVSENPEFNSVTVGEPAYQKADGTPVNKVGDKYYTADGQEVAAGDVVKATKPAVNMTAEAAKPATNNGNNQPSTALNITSADGKPTQITGVGSTLNTTTVNTNPDGKADTPVTENKLVNLTENGVNPNSAATVGDLQNMGWVVSATGNGYTDTVKNANKVDFVGKGLATVTGETKDGVRTITVNVDAQRTVEAADTPVIYTDKDGKKLTKVGDSFYKADDVTVIDGKAYPKGAVKDPQTGEIKKDGVEVAEKTENDAVKPADVIASMNDGDNKADSPKQLANVGGNLAPTYNKGDAKETETDGKPNGKLGDTTADAPTKSQTAPTADDVKKMYNNAATVGDVLNAGWNLQGNGSAVDFVKPYDTVNFVDGAGTKVEVTASEDGKTSTVKVNVDKGVIKAETKDGKETGKVLGADTAALDKAVTDAQAEVTKAQEAKVTADAGTDDAAKEKAAQDLAAAEKALSDAKAAKDAVPNKVATVENVVEAINKSGFTLKADKTDGDNLTADATLKANGELINPGDTVTMQAGKNMTVKQEADGKITYATKDEVNFKSVEVGNAEPTYRDADGNELVKVGDDYYKKSDYDNATVGADGKKDLTNVAKATMDKAKSEAPVKLAQEKGVSTKETTLNGDGTTATKTKDAPSALSVKDSLGENSQINGIASALDTKEVATKPLAVDADGNPVADKQTSKDTLVDLTEPTDEAEKAKWKSSAVTVGDIANMGWIVSATGNEYKDTVKNANQVDFVGTGLATVTGETKGGIRTITVNVDAQRAVETADMPVIYTDKDGNKLTKVGDNFYKADDVTVIDGKVYPKNSVVIDGKVYPEGSEKDPVTGKVMKDGEEVAEQTASTPENSDNVIASMNDGDNKADSPKQLANVKSTLADTHSVKADAVGKDGKTLVKAADGKYYPFGTEMGEDGNPKDKTITGLAADDVTLVTTATKVAPTSAEEAAKLANSSAKNNAATVGDVLNAGWNLQGNGSAVDFVKPYDTVNFVDGAGTKVEVTTDGQVSNVKVNVDAGKVTTVTKEDPTSTADAPKPAINTGKVAGPIETALKAANKTDEQIKDITDKLAALNAAKEALANNKDDAKKAELEAAVTAKTNELTTALGGENSPVKVEDLAKLENKVATAQDIANAINNTGFTLKTSATTGGEKDTASTGEELINPGETVEMVAGKNLTVKQEANGKVTYATKDEVNFKSVEVGNAEPTYKDKNGNELVKVGDDYYKKSDYDNATVGADGKKDLTNVAKATMDKAKSEAPVKLAQEKGVATKETTLGADGKTETTTAKDAPSALSVKDSLGENSQINGIASALDTKEEATKPTGKEGAAGKDTLVDLTYPTLPENATDEEKEAYKAAKAKWESSAVTVGDIANMGWIVSASGNEYTDTVKNANKVEFKGENGISVTGKTVGGVREITVSLEKGEVIGVNEGTVKIDGKDTDVVKVGGEYFKKEDIDPTTGKPKEGTTALGNDVVGNNGKNVVNNGDKFVDGHSVAKAIQESGFTVGKETDTSSVDFNNSDEKVNPNDELRFADGKGTTVSTGTVKTIDPNGEVSTKTVVKVDIDQGDMDADGGKLIDKILDDAEKAVEEKQAIVKDLAANPDNINDLIKAANDLKAAQDALAKLEEALDPDTAAAREKVTAAENALKQLSKEENPNVNDLIKAAKDVEDARNELTKAKDAAPNKVATVADVVEAVNRTGFTLKTSANGGTKISGDDELINPADTIDMAAGKNLTVKQDANGKVTYATAENVNFTSVQFGDNGPKINAAGNNLNVNGAKITGVAKGNITKDSTDAVNGAQIYALTGGAVTEVKDITVTNPKTGEEKVIKDVIVDKDGNPALVTYNVDEQGEYIQNSVISAINHMNTQGIKYFHTRDGSNRNTDDQQFNGEDSRATGKFSTAIGYQAHAKGDNAVAFGNKAVAGEDGVAIGHGAVASGKQSISIGTGNKVTGNHSGAIGDLSFINADNSYSMGNHNVIAQGQTDVFALGNNVKNTTSNSVFLGSNSGYVAASETTAGAGALESQVTGGVFNAYAGGKASEVKGVVSVGNVNSDGTMETRRIQNVAPGLISEKSTDAINGSQLYSLVANQNAQIGDIYNKMDREHKGLRAGIAGAAALAGIPEVHVAGRSMIAAAASAYKSENAVAVGYSRLSDNSKIKLKLTGSANSRGDVMGTVGVGYMW